MLFVLTVVLHPRSPSFLALENVGQSLHPRLARSLIGLLPGYLKDADRQVLLTTHNPLVLDALDLSNDEIRLLAVSRSAEGHTTVRRIEYNQALERAEASGLTLSRMWTQGLLGAVPNLD